MGKKNNKNFITSCFLLSLFFISVSSASVEARSYCPRPVINGAKEFGWNDHDQKTLKSAYKRCSEKYRNSPCVKVFNKIGKQNYTVICGRGK